MKTWKHEPIIHSHITDILPENHKLAYEFVECDKCKQSLHDSINECMQTWVECDFGNYCIKCFKFESVLPGKKFMHIYGVRRSFYE